MLCYFYTLAYISLADATIVMFTNPIFTALFARFVRNCPVVPATVTFMAQRVSNGRIRVYCLLSVVCCLCQILKEEWTVFDAGACALSFVGVIFVAQPAFLFGESDAPLSTAGSSSMDVPQLTTTFRTICVFVGVAGAKRTIPCCCLSFVVCRSLFIVFGL
jgi:drug/metabolite transporter (DMT)-like permease